MPDKGERTVMAAVKRFTRRTARLESELRGLSRSAEGRVGCQSEEEEVRLIQDGVRKGEGPKKGR